jgi:predicted phosphohydrolase
VAALHYPPTTPNFEKTVVTEKLTAAGIQHCVFGHIHSMKEGTVFEGTLDGVSYHCCSCDYINFDPVLITEI